MIMESARKRDKQIFVRVTEEEKAKILQLASSVGMNLSEYLRFILVTNQLKAS